jgi:two-component system chemotaxis response regulator CheY
VSYDLKKISVLIVEDNQPMLELLKSLLDTFGFDKIYAAKNGEEGFKAYCRYKPDLVITDWMMRPVDGISLTRRIRNDPMSANQFTPIVLMTGFTEKRRVMQARDAGITEFLVKPFNARDLYRRLAQIIEHPRQFVRSEDFFGPDRRRKQGDSFVGPFRRAEDLEQGRATRIEASDARTDLAFKD